jgi:hypothetical protein
MPASRRTKILFVGLPVLPAQQGQIFTDLDVTAVASPHHGAGEVAGDPQDQQDDQHQAE